MGSKDLSSLSLVSMFRAEAAQHAATLCELLLQPAPAASRAALWFEELMRACHSLKGVARIVGLDALVGLAHTMEDGIVQHQRASKFPDSRRVDLLLEGADVFGSVATQDDPDVPPWLKDHGERIAQLTQALEALANPQASAAAGPRLAALPDAPSASAPDPVPAASANICGAADALPLRSAPAAASTPVSAPPPAVEEAEARRLSLSAATLDTLQTLARESLLVHDATDQDARLLRQIKRRLRSGQRLLVQDALTGVQPDVRAWRDQLQQLQDLVERFSERHERLARRGRQAAHRLYHTVRRTRMTRLGDTVLSWRRLVHELSWSLSKPVRLEVQGQETLLDRDVLQRIEAPLQHLISNAIDHGLESTEARAAAGKPAEGRILLRARHHRGRLCVELEDDGRGIDVDKLRARILQSGKSTPDMLAQMSESELLAFLFLPGFSTRETLSAVSGRGVGLDVVQTQVHQLGGRIRVHNRPGQGTRFELTLPVSVSVARALLVQVQGEPYALALSQIERVDIFERQSLQSVGGRQCCRVGADLVPVLPLAGLLGLQAAPATERMIVVIVGTGPGRCALEVDHLLGERSLGLLPLDARLGQLRHVTAAAILDDGSPVLVLDSDSLESAVSRFEQHRDQATPSTGAAKARARVLVVEDSFTVREVERQILQAAGFEVEVRVDGEDGWAALAAGGFDLMITDIDMPRLDGIALLKRVRASPRLAAMPVMIVSYKDSPEDRLAGLEAGANGYFVKSSFDDMALRAAVEDLIGAA